jgi:hypothetical protein
MRQMYHEVGREITVRNFETQKHTGCLLLSSSSHDAIAAAPLEEVTLQLIFRPQVHPVSHSDPKSHSISWVCSSEKFVYPAF